jgi:hypothetical protein
MLPAFDHGSASGLFFVRLELELELDGCFHFPRLEFMSARDGGAGCLTDPATGLAAVKAQRGRLANELFDGDGLRLAWRRVRPGTWVTF